MWLLGCLYWQKISKFKVEVSSNNWCAHQIWEVIWWVNCMARWAYIFVGTIHVLYKLFHFSLMCGQQSALTKFSLNLYPSVPNKKKSFLCSLRDKARQVWSINLSVFISWFFLSLCHITSSKSGASKVPPPIIGPNDQIFVWLHSLVWVHSEVWPVRY
jgi:hypothetical protein